VGCLTVYGLEAFHFVDPLLHGYTGEGIVQSHRVEPLEQWGNVRCGGGGVDSEWRRNKQSLEILYKEEFVEYAKKTKSADNANG
jgi:hypothetical protein